jgi:hypothetical protein
MFRATRGLVVTVSTTVVLAFGTFLMNTSAAEATPIDCIVQPQPPQGACYEPVWVDGKQITMVFPQAGQPLDPVPHAKTQPFYVTAPLTDTAQGPQPGFPHDHVIEAAPGEAGWTPFFHGYFVLCSAGGISTGACSFMLESPFGPQLLPFTTGVTGYDLTTAAGIQAAADAGLVVLVDLGVVLKGTVTGG